jgi:hypothetical protein
MLGLFEEALRTGDTPPPPEPPDYLANADFGYRIESFAGRGGSGLVWKARGKQDGLPVALKLIPFHGDPEALRYRWAAEVAAAATIQHRHLVGLRGQGIAPDGGSAWLALEWIEGSCLARLLARKGRLPWHQALDFTLQACAGLSALHAAGLVHRDIKPANLLLEESSGRLVVADLGIALDLAGNPEARLTRTCDRAATPGYAPPERFLPDHVPHAAGDQYSLAVTLWELVAGTRPVGAFPPLHSLAKAPPGVDRVLRRALAPDPVRRHPSIAAFARALQRASRWHAPFHKPALIALGLGLAALPLARHFATPPPAAAEQAPEFPLRIRSADLPVADGRDAFMGVDLTLERNGEFRGFIRTYSREALTGFTGVVVLAFRDRDGNLLTALPSAPLGVNGRWIPGQRPDRTDEWHGRIDPALIPRIATVEPFATLAGLPWQQRLKYTAGDIRKAVQPR